MSMTINANLVKTIPLLPSISLLPSRKIMGTIRNFLSSSTTNLLTESQLRIQEEHAVTKKPEEYWQQITISNSGKRNRENQQIPSFNLPEILCPAAVVINNFIIGNRPGVLYNWSTDGVDPIFLLFLGISYEKHGLGPGGELKSVLLVEYILGAFDREASSSWNHPTRYRTSGDRRFLEPEELSLLQNEPAASPSLNVLPLFH